MQKPIIVAHRGASGYFKENTLSSIIHAVELNSDVIEIDLRLTKDSVLVLSHDDIHVYDENIYKISECEYSMIKKGILSFEDLLLVINKKVKFYLDIKCTEKNISVFSSVLLNILKKYNASRFIIASFSSNFIKYFSRLTDSYDLGIIYETFDNNEYNIIKNLVKFVVLDIDYVTIAQLGVIKFKTKYLYTVNDLNKLEPYLNDIDGIVTDYPDIYNL